jgi:ABC-2 type transport system permease protein
MTDSMSQLWNLVRKDLKSFFFHPLFYMIAFVCTLFWTPIYIFTFGMYLSQLLTVMGVDGEFLSFQERVVTEFVSLINFMLLLVVNSITMRLLSEEKKNHTFELLLTSPLRSWQIVVAKYISGVVIMSALVLIAFLYPLTTSFLGRVEWGAVLCAYLGLLLLGSVYVAVGLLASSLTRSVLISFILALILNLSLWFLGAGDEIVENPSWHLFFQSINLEPIFKDFTHGVLRLPGIVYLLSLSLFSLIATERVVESSRWQ